MRQQRMCRFKGITAMRNVIEMVQLCLDRDKIIQDSIKFAAGLPIKFSPLKIHLVHLLLYEFN